MLGTSLLFLAQYQVTKPPEITICKCGIYLANEYYNITHEDSKGKQINKRVKLPLSLHCYISIVHTDSC
uniref:Secreted protein n=1 Tax=Trichogramma kaykai TaxID=54128 RepID=A0ABD2XD15_9HYME